MHDLIIRGGTVVDGTGAPRFAADIAIDNGRITAVGNDLGDAREILDATGLVVTPGFVDIHTHYDGQATWDDLLEPSSGHGVTTVVAGNCGVGFAPVRPGKEEWLVQLMEGVEDIPGTALHEGISWGWESFPEYLDVLDARHYAIDIATYIGHGPVRAYVMGDRGARNEPASPEDIAGMKQLVTEAIKAGAIGFSSSRTLNHKARDGEPVPGTFAAEDELNGLADGVSDAGGGLFEIAPQGLEFEAEVFLGEVDLLSRIALRTGLPVTFAMLQNERNPDSWREALKRVDATNAAGGNMRPQIAARPFGMMIGWANNNPFTKRPTVVDLVGRLDGDALRTELRKPEIKATVLSETDLPSDPSIQFDGLGPFLQLMLDKIYAMGDTPNYEPSADHTVAALAAAAGVDPLDMAYDLLNEADGNAFLMLPFFNYVGGTQDAIYEMLRHPATVSGLSDGGAHCRMICDASIPTYVLSHWARDREGDKLSLEDAVKCQTSDTAEVMGFHDRGTIQLGKRADLNVIDMASLDLEYPRAVDDLPAGGRRLMQAAHGYVATIVNGEITRRNGIDTGARPGRLVRSSH
ncbi:unannotated protein [freshwater metagenome]|uniref:Unannotated protein n=1 Tax=freshwater metagenome TaxID=449393 RepID=A0A6J7FG77_9ZZZZ|nr:amidohydrolase family protein [Actinomycetota bacterium]